MGLLNVLNVVLKASHVLAGDANVSWPCCYLAFRWRHLDGVTGLKGQLRAVPVEASSNDFLTLSPTVKKTTSRAGRTSVFGR